MTTIQLSKAERSRREAQGARIAQLRLDRTGLSPEAFGDLIHVSGSTIRQIEAGRGTRQPHVRVMFAIAKGLGCPASELFPPERTHAQVSVREEVSA